jgi:hypothetical protein
LRTDSDLILSEHANAIEPVRQKKKKRTASRERQNEEDLLGEGNLKRMAASNIRLCVCQIASGNKAVHCGVENKPPGLPFLNGKAPLLPFLALFDNEGVFVWFINEFCENRSTSQ